MLEGLDSVPWSRLEHAYGKASDVPGLIRAVASPDRDLREKAWYELYGNIWHQHTVYEATAHAVPFFIELAQHPATPDREQVLAYLVNLRHGSSYRDVHRQVPMLGHIQHEPGFDERLRREREWVAATVQAVRKGRNVYVRLLNNEVPAVRTVAAHLLGLFPEDAAENLASLREHLARGEPDERARAHAVLAVGRLGKHAGDDGAWLQESLRTDRSEAVRAAAALGLAWTRGRDLPPSAYELIRRLARDPGPAAVVFEDPPWGDHENVLGNYCSEALGLLRDPADDSIAALATAMDEVADHQSLEIARQLLNRVFNGQPMPSTMCADELTADQRLVLSAIAVCQKLWGMLDGGVFMTGTVELMREFGLPLNVTNLRAFLEGRLSPRDPGWTQPFLLS